MIPLPIRWRLPLSYAAIALLVAISLGIVLPVPVRSYYSQLELNYLTGNAQTIAKAIEATREVNGASWLDVVRQSQLQQLAFLSQTRVRITGAGGEVLADSGPAEPRSVSLMRVMISAPLGTEISGTVKGAAIAYGTDITNGTIDQPPSSAIYVNSTKEVTTSLPTLPLTNTMAIVSVRETQGETGASGVFYTFSTVGTPFGFGLGEQTAQDDWRSTQVVQYPLNDADGTLVGYVQLSEGPSYGGQIVNSLTRGLIIAGVISVLLATGVGLVISRSIGTPLAALTQVTTRMAAGDLSARANVLRKDELGTLALSFNEMAGQVEETIRTLRTFLADAAHELNTPLTALRTDLELLGDAGDAPARSHFVAQAQAQVERLQALASGLLDLSRAEGGRAIARGKVDLNALVQNVSETYASRAEQGEVSFNLQVPQVALGCEGDAAQLQRALSNLLDNALKFTPANGAVSLTLACVGEVAEIRVEDTGIGIPDADLPLLFSRFHRGRNAAAYPGNGLGLAIVKAIVEGHGGSVSITSSAQGTCATLCLPLCQ
jgi:signal transduction histidine kinase